MFDSSNTLANHQDAETCLAERPRCSTTANGMILRPTRANGAHRGWTARVAYSHTDDSAFCGRMLMRVYASVCRTIAIDVPATGLTVLPFGGACRIGIPMKLVGLTVAGRVDLLLWLPAWLAGRCGARLWPVVCGVLSGVSGRGDPPGAYGV